MKQIRPAVLAAVLGLAALSSQTLAADPPMAPAAQIAAMPRCVWAKAADYDRNAVRSAADALNLAAVDVLMSHLADDSAALARQCAPGVERNVRTRSRLMLLGFNQEAMADLIERDLGLKRERLDQAIAAAPPEIIAGLRETADKAGPRRYPGPLPAMGPIFTALGQPTYDGPPPTKTAFWIASYLMNSFQLRAAAETFAPSP